MQEVFFLLYEVEGEFLQLRDDYYMYITAGSGGRAEASRSNMTNGHDLDQCFRLLKETSKMTQ